MAAKTGIEYKPDGTIQITFDGVVRHLRNPKVKEVRFWQSRRLELAEQIDEDRHRAEALLKEVEDGSEEEKEQAQKEYDEWRVRRREFLAPWIAGVVEELSNKPLPEDAGDWPSWLAFDLTTPGKFLDHWNTTPLASG